MACPRIVGLDVSPVTARSRTYRASAPVRSMTRLMLSSHRLWPSVCSRCAELSSASMRASRNSAVASPASWPEGDGGDLYLRTIEEDRADRGPHWPWMGEVALVYRVEAVEVGQVGEVDQARHDVRGRTAGRAEQRGHLAERALGLVLDCLARSGLAGQEHPLTGRKPWRVRPGRRGSWGCDRRFVRHSSSAIFSLKAASAASS